MRTVIFLSVIFICDCFTEATISDLTATFFGIMLVFFIAMDVIELLYKSTK